MMRYKKTIYDFLARLDNEFDKIRGDLLRLSPLPKLEESFAFVCKEAQCRCSGRMERLNPLLLWFLKPLLLVFLFLVQPLRTKKTCIALTLLQPQLASLPSAESPTLPRVCFPRPQLLLPLMIILLFSLNYPFKKLCSD
ncbi:unnamed protein product [Prunus brigantina]